MKNCCRWHRTKWPLSPEIAARDGFLTTPFNPNEIVCLSVYRSIALLSNLRSYGNAMYCSVLQNWWGIQVVRCNRLLSTEKCSANLTTGNCGNTEYGRKHRIQIRKSMPLPPRRLVWFVFIDRNIIKWLVQSAPCWYIILFLGQFPFAVLTTLPFTQ